MICMIELHWNSSRRFKLMRKLKTESTSAVLAYEYVLTHASSAAASPKTRAAEGE